MAFLTFGVVSLLLALFMLPYLAVVGGSPAERQLRGQRVVQRGFIFFCWLLEALGLARIHTHDIARLAEPGTLVVANHPTLIDAVVLVAAMPQADVIVKQANLVNPFMRGMVKACGYLPNLGGQSLIDACVERLESGRSLLLFPEGTRSPRNGLGPFQRGAARIALASGRDPLPVLISCDPPTLMKGQPWYEVPDRPFEVHVRVGEPIPVEGYIGRDEPLGRTARALSSSLREIFEKGLVSGSV